VLGHGVWQRQFGGRTDIIGSEVRLSGESVTVIGVLPPGFRLPLDYRQSRPTEVFLSLAIDTARELPWGDRSFFVVARLDPGVTVPQSAAALASAHRRWKQEVAQLADDPLEARAPLPLRELLFRDVERALDLLFVAVGVLLLIACANLAHLLLASGDARRRELATQAVLGASRPRLVTQLLTENLVLALLGGMAGVGFAWLIVRAAMAWAPVNAIRISGVGLDGGVLLFAACVAFAATLVAGIVPALSLSQTRSAELLAGARGVAGTMRGASRRLLVVGEMALSLVLVLSALLLAQSYAGLRAVDLGFDTRHVVTLRVDLPSAKYGEDGRASRFFSDVLDRFATVPGVEAAGAVRVLPLSETIGNWTRP
jgi:predicted permease